MLAEILIYLLCAAAILLPGAVLEGGILGTVRNKVGNVVAATWKGINYVKAYTIPANPNSSAQQVQRTFFAAIVRAGQLILSSVIQPYWDPFAIKQSGFTRFMQKNLLDMSTPFSYAELSVAEGGLEKETITSATYEATEGLIHIDWIPSGLGNGEATDLAIMVVYDEANDVAFVDANTTREETNAEFLIGAGRTATNLRAYLFFSRGAGSELEVSDSDYSAVAAS